MHTPIEPVIDDRDPHGAEGLTAEIPGDEFIPYVPASATGLKELTLLVLVLGAVQAAVFGVADAYLGLKIGTTVGASIPAAVMSMGILRFLLKRNSILENNLMQNMASVGESLAGGACFTIPALYLLNDWLVKTGQPAAFDTSIPKLYFIGCMGGLMGILFMIPMRRYLIVKEHGKLKYPEGTACAEVLIAGDQGGDSAKTVFASIGVAALYRMLMDPNSLGLYQEIVAFPFPYMGTVLSFDMLPSLLAVGFILGIQTCGIMTSGAIFGWFVIIPLIHYFGQYVPTAIFPATKPIAQLDPYELHKFYLKYIGAGAVAFGGVISLFKALPTVFESLKAAWREITSKHERSKVKIRTQDDLPLWVVGALSLVLFLIIGFSRGVNYAGFLGALLATVFAFFFVTVASRIVGLVGTTSMPLSGMTIGALLTTCIVLKWSGLSGPAGMAAAMVVSAMICIAISMGGDISQDLKIGFLVGATPKWVQLTQIIGVLISGSIVAWVVGFLAPQILDGRLQAPQANLIFLITRGVLEGNLPWIPVLIGMAIAACVEMLGIGSLPFAVGLYLPLELSTTVMIGGLLHAGLMYLLPARTHKEANDTGLLVASGLVAGDALCGVGLAILSAKNVVLGKYLFGDRHFAFADAPITTLVMFALLAFYLWQRVYSHVRTAREDLPAPG